MVIQVLHWMAVVNSIPMTEFPGRRYMPSIIFTKTIAGSAEVATNQMKLPRRLRNVLLMVNGSRTLSDFAAELGSKELAVDALDQLVEAKLIEPKFPSA